MKIVNTSDKPYEFAFNSCTYGPFAPGQIIDLPDEVALHGIKRSIILDEEGNYLSQKAQPLDQVKTNPAMMEKLIKYDCPMAASEQCSAGPFASLDALREHLETAHWKASEKKPMVGKGSGKGQSDLAAFDQ